MKFPILFALGAALLATAGGPTRGQPSAPKDSYVKVRVEVESRGVLKVAGKDATLETRYQYHDQQNPMKERSDPEGLPPHKIVLDFSRHPELLELAKALNGKEFVLTGLSELRHLSPPPSPPGGFVGGMPGGFPGGFPTPYPMPTWHLHPTVLVTGLKTVPAKR